MTVIGKKLRINIILLENLHSNTKRFKISFYKYRAIKDGI